MRSGFLVGGAALAHDECANRTMRKMGAHIKHALHSRERVEVFAERLPFEVDSSLEGLGRNVLDSVHRDAVPARRREIRVPCDLAVIVCMDVDPARRDEQPIGGDLAAALLYHRR
jgi:hypothetical protein